MSVKYTDVQRVLFQITVFVRRPLQGHHLQTLQVDTISESHVVNIHVELSFATAVAHASAAHDCIESISCTPVAFE